jgi:hypothetical protein
VVLAALEGIVVRGDLTSGASGGEKQCGGNLGSHRVPSIRWNAF